ncbi:MAG: GDP-mannose 4,6-dehydratase [Anaerolineales bacterium]
MHILITGSSGFVGSQLANYVSKLNWQVSGFDLRSNGTINNFFQGELGDRIVVTNTLNNTKPDVIFHLAGLIKSPDAQELYNANVLGTVTLFDSIIDCGLRPLVVMASSSAVYGMKSGREPIGERTQVRPVTHYAVSKAAQELVALRYFDSYQLPVRIVRMFNLLGPGQSPGLACSSFARQIALAEKHGKDDIFTGNLDAYRDFVDVRDAARAFAMISENGQDGQIYNVCSEQAVSLQECLSEMMSMSPRQLTARLDAERVQKNDLPIQVGSFQKIKKACGWRPQISLKESLTDLLNDWRERVKSEAE